jgi:hypothetical protein
MKVDYSKRMKALMEVIRERPDWMRCNHTSVEFGDSNVGYYDADKGQDFFILKFGDIKINHQGGDIMSIELPISMWNEFNLDAWLSKLEAIVKQETMILNGKKYILTPVK